MSRFVVAVRRPWGQCPRCQMRGLAVDLKDPGRRDKRCLYSGHREHYRQPESHRVEKGEYATGARYVSNTRLRSQRDHALRSYLKQDARVLTLRSPQPYSGAMPSKQTVEPRRTLCDAVRRRAIVPSLAVHTEADLLARRKARCRREGTFAVPSTVYRHDSVHPSLLRPI